MTWPVLSRCQREEQQREKAPQVAGYRSQAWRAQWAQQNSGESRYLGDVRRVAGKDVGPQSSPISCPPQ